MKLRSYGEYGRFWHVSEIVVKNASALRIQDSGPTILWIPQVVLFRTRDYAEAHANFSQFETRAFLS